MNTRKIVTIVVPLLIGGGILFSLLKLTGPKSEPAATSSITVPQNSAHEKASLEEQLQKNPGHPPILLRLGLLQPPASAREGLGCWPRALARSSPRAPARHP